MEEIRIDVTKQTKEELSLAREQSRKNAWVGAGATILPGVTVGDNAVVGAASMVTKDVAPWTIVAGNPAKLIKAISPQTHCADRAEEEEIIQLGLDSCGD